MKRTVLTWAIFSAALILVLTVMVYFTWRMLRFEREVTVADAKAGMEETIRLALRRMDYAAPALLAPKEIAKAPVTAPPKEQQKRNYRALNNTNAMQSQNPAQQRLVQSYQDQLNEEDLQLRMGNTLQPRADWRAIKPDLLKEISDLIPDAQLEPMDKAHPDDPRQLASIPARLVVPAAAFEPPALAWNTPLRISLMVAWIFTVVASIAVATLLSGAMALSERRGAFVSAVTHELRTPLTTFKMYSEMLATGMVSDPADRQQYLDTLVCESDRLGYLIENVLAYARLERQLSPSRAQTIRIGDLFDRALPALRRRAQQANLPIDAQIPADAAGQMCATDTIAVQQILLNLADNACKYGRTPIEVSVGVVRQQMEFRVSDSGPGLDPAAAARLFKAFSKSRTDTIPGIGLGLFLSRRLARDLGGDLRHIATEQGATFVLSLPISG